MHYGNLVGGMITCQFPYLVVILFGWYFSKMKVLEKDMIKPLAKTIMIIFLPVFYFMWIGKATSTSNLSNYNIIIISEIIKTTLSIAVSYLYAKFTNMDLRYRYTWIVH